VQRTLLRGPRIHHLPLTGEQIPILTPPPLLLLGVFLYVPLTHRSQEAEQRYSGQNTEAQYKKRAAGISILLAFYLYNTPTTH